MTQPSPFPALRDEDQPWWRDAVQVADKIERCTTCAAIGTVVIAAMPVVLAALRGRARATAAEAALLEKDGEIERLVRFVDYVRMWRDRGPPHGDPVTAWSVVAHHPFVTARDRAFSPTEPLPATDDEASHVSGS